jgi:hypothetical protein
MFLIGRAGTHRRGSSYASFLETDYLQELLLPHSSSDDALLTPPRKRSLTSPRNDPPRAVGSAFPLKKGLVEGNFRR